MTRDSFTVRSIGVAGSCALAALAVMRCRTSPAPTARQAAPSTNVARRNAHVTPPPTPDTELRRQLAGATTIVALPTPDHGGPALLAPQPLSPELERARQAALVAWTAQAQQQLGTCVARPASDRRTTSMTVFFAPEPRAERDPIQRVFPRWVALPPAELDRLAQDVDPTLLQGCLGQLTRQPLTLALSGAALAHSLPPAAEHVVVQL